MAPGPSCPSVCASVRPMLTSTFLRFLALCVQIYSGAVPGTPPPDDQILAAIAAETPTLPAELLLAVAAVESNYDPTWVSRVEDGARKIGRWRSDLPVGEGPRCCGVMQTRAGRRWKTCLAQRGVTLGYQTGATELASWLDRTGDVRKALAGYGCGNAGLASGCGTYPARVLARARRMGWSPPRRSTSPSS